MDQVTFADVIQKSFIAMSMGGTDRITTLNIIINVAMSFLVGMFIFFMYKRTFQGVLYQRSFNISLVLACTITSLIIMTISGNLILSLGMVGALSIVRFRTPIKDSMDLIFLFWAISVGIANGVGYFNISVIGSALIAIFLLLLTRTQGSQADTFLLVLSFTPDANEAELMERIKNNTINSSLKSKTVTADGTELTIEVRTSDSGTQFINDLQKEGTVSRATLVSYDQSLAAI
ncbi:MAG: DUF4956 domain-containing protein [bacterium]